MLIHRKMLLIGVGVLLTMPLPAPSFSCELDVPSSWRLRQNNGYVLKFKNRKWKPAFKADVSISGQGGTGKATGTVDQAFMNFKIYWDNGSVGLYSLSYSPDGFLIGATRDVNNDNKVGVRSLTEVDCR